MVSQYLDVRVGGAERYIGEVCTRLESQHGMELHFLSADPQSELSLSPAIISAFSSSFHPTWRQQVNQFLDDLRPDVIYGHHTVPGLTDVVLPEARRRKIPVALMYHSDVIGPEPAKRALGQLYHHLFGRRLLSACDVIFVSSRQYVLSSPFLRDINVDFIEAPPGVDPIVSKGKRKTNGPYVLFIGKPHVKSKGYGVLQRAWETLHSRHPNVELVVVGGRPKVAPINGVRHVGHVDSREELGSLYASAEVTVLPSTSTESFGMVLAEALSAGCPIIGTDVGGISSIVEDHFNGYLVPPGDLLALATALGKALEYGTQLRQNVASKREDYLERYSWDRTAAVTAKALAAQPQRTHHSGSKS